MTLNFAVKGSKGLCCIWKKLARIQLQSGGVNVALLVAMAWVGGLEDGGLGPRRATVIQQPVVEPRV